MNQEVIEKTFAVSGQARLVLKNISGEIRLEAGEPGQIYVRAVKRLDRGDPQNTLVEISQAEDGSVLACTHYPRKDRPAFPGPFNQPSPVAYTVRLPRECRLQAEGVSGALFAEGLHGELDLRTVSGGVQAAGLSGRVLLHSVSGCVTGENLAGDIVVQTVSGPIRLEGQQISSCRSQSTSGEIRLAGPLTDGPYHFKTISGHVRLSLPGPAALDLNARTFSGKVHVAPPIRTAAAGIPVRADTLSGHIWVQAAAAS